MSAPASTSGKVISLSGRNGYRPDFRAMASGHVRAAREKLRMDHEGFAAYLSDTLDWHVQADVLARWESGQGTPRGDVVLACGAAAQGGPALDKDPREGIMVWAGRGLITRQQWNGIITGSREHLWLYGMAEAGYAEDDEVPGILEDAAAAGCEIRVLLLTPAYADIADLDASEGKPAGTLAARIQASMASFAVMRGRCGERMQVRAYSAPPSVSVIRGDDEMLITPYLRHFPGDNSPTFGITASSAPRMFGQYARHFSFMWDQAREGQAA